MRCEMMVALPVAVISLLLDLVPTVVLVLVVHRGPVVVVVVLVVTISMLLSLDRLLLCALSLNGWVLSPSHPDPLIDTYFPPLSCRYGLVHRLPVVLLSSAAHRLWQFCDKRVRRRRTWWYRYQNSRPVVFVRPFWSRRSHDAGIADHIGNVITPHPGANHSVANLDRNYDT